ncbi:MAG TPA: histidine phosphatase family protein [Steroidobacteraceae bacterium]
MKLALAALIVASLGCATAQAATPPNDGPCAAPSHGPASGSAASDAPRRRIYLVRHGEANYVGADGKALPWPDAAGLSDRGRDQARAAAAWFCAMGVTRFDKVVTSDLPRATQTAEVLLATMGLSAVRPDASAALRELDPQRESARAARTRILPVLERLRAESWDTALIVAHTLVDEVILSEALTGSNVLYGRLEQGNGCINILDLGPGPQEWVVRAVNVCPDPALYWTRQSLQDRLRQ